MKKIILIIVVVIGILLAIQIRSFKKVEFLIERSGSKNIFAELRTFQLANQQLGQHLKDEEKALEDIKNSLTGASVEEEINRLRILSGEEAIIGEGLELTFGSVIKAFWLTDLIAQLVSSGAEAIAINDIRITDKTFGFKNVASGILMRRYFISAPFKVTVIGPAKELKIAIAQEGGILSRMEKSQPQLKVSLIEKDKLIIPSLTQ